MKLYSKETYIPLESLNCEYKNELFQFIRHAGSNLISFKNFNNFSNFKKFLSTKRPFKFTVIDHRSFVKKEMPLIFFSSMMKKFQRENQLTVLNFLFRSGFCTWYYLIIPISSYRKIRKRFKKYIGLILQNITLVQIIIIIIIIIITYRLLSSSDYNIIETATFYNPLIKLQIYSLSVEICTFNFQVQQIIRKYYINFNCSLNLNLYLNLIYISDTF